MCDVKDGTEDQLCYAYRAITYPPGGVKGVNRRSTKPADERTLLFSLQPSTRTFLSSSLRKSPSSRDADASQ